MTTTENKLHFIVVPIDSEGFVIHNFNGCLYFLFRDNEDDEYDVANKYIGEGKYEIVGAIHPENGGLKWSFDPEKYVDKHKSSNVGADDKEYFYWMYKNYCGDGLYFEATDSFLSKMKAESGLYFFNPLGEKPKFSDDCYSYGDGDAPDQEGTTRFTLKDEESFKKDLAAWRESESKRITQKVVVLMELKTQNL